MSRKVGNAVMRNRVKRAIREFFRASREMLPSGVDAVVIARPGAATLSSALRDSELEHLFHGATS